MPKTHAVISAYLETHVTALENACAAMGAGEQGSVHDARVACRRMRSVLQSAKPLWRAQDAKVVVHARNLCREYAAHLSGARDTEALLELVQEWAAEAGWDGRSVTGVERALERYVPPSEDDRDEEPAADDEPPRGEDVIAAVRAVLDLPWPKDTKTSGRQGLMLPVQRSVEKVIVAMGHAAACIDPDAHVEALHDVRKTTKRVRYVCDMVRDHEGSVRELSDVAKRVQETIGYLQDADAMVARLEGNTTRGATLVTDRAMLHARTALEILPEQLEDLTAAALKVLRHA